jgi:L-threonylcarbamoyladenylate synthase
MTTTPFRMEVRASDLTPAGVLRNEHVRAIVDVLVRRGGFAMLPSDTCYSLATVPGGRLMSERINRILTRPEGEPISVSFDGIPLMKEWVELNEVAIRFLDSLTPGPLTLVCDAAPTLNPLITEDVLDAPDGTVGVRIPDSNIERQVVTACKKPVTTPAVRTLDKVPVTDYQQAREIIEEGLARNGEPFALITVEARNPFLETHSTVVRVQGKTLEGLYHVIRPGAISKDQLEEALFGFSGARR